VMGHGKPWRCLATGVESPADRSLRRPARRWGRRITLQLPVHDVQHWSTTSVVVTLVEALNFLTGDLWTLDFKPRKHPAPSPLQRPLRLVADAKAVMPFSDGLDSWAVAIIEKHELGAEPIRVRLSSRKTGRKPSDPHLPFAFVPYKVKAKSNNQPSTTGRHRGFKFTMISAIAAYLANVNRVIVSESGQGALGPALVPVGQMYPDYRSHPLFTMRMERFVAALFGRSIRYDFPRLWFTKGETLLAANRLSIDDDAWKKTRSCWQGNRRAGIGGERRQCGICAGCILRRVSVHAAGQFEEKQNYIWENLGVSTFEKGSAPTFSKTIKPFQQYFIAGVLHMDHLAELARSRHAQATLGRHAFELAQWRGGHHGDIAVKLRRLLEKHAEEWKSFVLSLGVESFFKPLARAAA
jgi:7-cyano-7-deazaguanine synthase in queuosine biosynthesis